MGAYTWIWWGGVVALVCVATLKLMLFRNAPLTLRTKFVGPAVVFVSLVVPYHVTTLDEMFTFYGFPFYLVGLDHNGRAFLGLISAAHLVLNYLLWMWLVQIAFVWAARRKAALKASEADT